MKFRLQHGYSPLDRVEFTDDELVAGWWEHRETVLAECQLGERPWGFWRFDAVDPPECEEIPVRDPGEDDYEARCTEHAEAEWEQEQELGLAGRGGHLSDQETD